MCVTICQELQLTPKFVGGYAERLTKGKSQMRLRRESAGCCDVGQAEIRLREKLARAQYTSFEHITVCGHPGCGVEQAREVSAAVAAFPGQCLKTEVTFEISFDQLLHPCELPCRKHRWRRRLAEGQIRSQYEKAGSQGERKRFAIDHTGRTAGFYLGAH